MPKRVQNIPKYECSEHCTYNDLLSFEKPKKTRITYMCVGIYVIEQKYIRKCTTQTYFKYTE